MVALLFVAASVAGGVFNPARTAPLRIFLSASVVHFSGILAASLIAVAPIHSRLVGGGLIVAAGLVGLGYYAVTWRDVSQDGIRSRIDWEDWTWYALLPVVAYCLEVGSGGGIALHFAAAPSVLALTLGTLMLVGIHNAWDITVWSIAKRND